MIHRNTSQWHEDGISLLDSGFFDSAIRCFDEVLQVEAANVRAWALKATALTGLERYDEAIECFDKALEIDHVNVLAWKGKALSLATLGREEEAAQCREEVKRITRGAEAPPSEEKRPMPRMYGTADGLVSDAVRGLAADEQEAWFAYGKDGGVTRLSLIDEQSTTYTVDDGLTSDAVRCVVMSEKDAWLGTDRGLSRFDRETEKWTAYTPDTGLPAEMVNDIIVDGELLWLGTEAGLLVLDSLTGRAVLCRGGPESVGIDCLLSDGHRVWCGADEEDVALSVFEKQTETFEAVDVGPYVQGLELFPRKGEEKVWVAHRDGITIVDRTTHETEEIALPTMIVTGIAVGVEDLLVSTARGLAMVMAHEAEAGQHVMVKMTDVGRGLYVSTVCASRTREWIAVEGQGVLSLSYSS